MFCHYCAATPLNSRCNRSNIGGIIVAVMMQQLNTRHPDNYLLAMRIIWAPVALMIIFWVFIPESPWFHARRGDKVKAMKCLRQLFGGVEGFDFDEEYAIIARTIEHEKVLNQERPSLRDTFRGLNRVKLCPLHKRIDSKLTMCPRNGP